MVVTRRSKAAVLQLWPLSLGAVVGAVYAIGGGRSYDYDESVTVGSFIATPSLFDPWRRQVVFNNHPLLSFLDHVVWTAGGTTEAWLRVVPMTAAAVTVVIVAWTARARWGAAAGVTAGVLLAAIPLFAGLGRSVRGYSILVLCALVAALLTERLLQDEPPPVARTALALVVAAGLATHLHFVIVIIGLVSYVIGTGRPLRPWLTLLGSGLVLGSCAYLFMLDQLAGATGRGRLFRPDFPTSAARALLGDAWLAVVILGACLALAAVVGRRDRPARWVAVAISAALLIVWLGVQPLDLYPRFVVWLTPVVALAGGWVVGRVPAAAPALLVATAAMALPQVPTWSEPAQDLRSTASLVDVHLDAGSTVCAVGGEALRAYTTGTIELSQPDAAGDCDAVVFIGEWITPEDVQREVPDRFPVVTTVPGRSDVLVLARGPTSR